MANVCALFRRWCRPCWLLGLLVAAGAAPLSAQPSKEYDIKAVFVFHFASFVEWPAGAEAGPGTPFVIGIIGENPFGPALAQIVAGEKIHGAPFEVRQFRSLDEVAHCQILFVSNSELPRLRLILERTAAHPVLTVGDTPQFVEEGGMIAFSTGTHVQLHVNAAAARASALTISSKLLRVAKVHGGER